MRDFSDRKAQLETRLDELDSRLRKIEDRLDAPKPRDWEESAGEREGDEVLEDLGMAGLKEIELIRAALSRIEDGSYGICAKCGDEISEARLDAVPHAVLCRNCLQPG